MCCLEYSENLASWFRLYLFIILLSNVAFMEFSMMT